MPKQHMSAFNAAVGNRLRELRTAASLTQFEISSRAARLGIVWARSSIAAVEAGQRSLSAYEWLSLPAIYGCEPEAFGDLRPVAPEEPVSVFSECDAKAAVALGSSVAWVAEQAVPLWGRSLDEERDARAAARIAGAVTNARQVQAIRGHATRTLIAELAGLLTAI